MTLILSKVWKQTTPHSLLQRWCKKAGLRATRLLASHTQKNPTWFFYFDLSFRQRDNTDKLSE